MPGDPVRRAKRLFRTGHPRIAERILQQITLHEPENTAAREALENIQRLKDTPLDSAKRQKTVIAWLAGIFVILLVSSAAWFFCSQPHASVHTPTATLHPATLQPSTQTPPIQTPSPTVALSTLTSTPFPTPLPTNDYPASALISNIKGQPMRISLDCEANSASIFAAYFGIKIDEVNFLVYLPVSDNPNKGFVGDVHDEWGNLPPKGYGVYPAPIVSAMNKLKVGVTDVYGYTLENIKREVAAGRPVIVWVIGRVESGEPLTYTSSDGESHIVARYEHTVLVIGYDDEQIVILDGDTIYRRSESMFLSSWGVLGNMAIIKSNP